MDKEHVIAVLEEIAVLLELSGENPFKARSYTNAARQIEQLDDDLEVLAQEHRLRDIEGVGDAIAAKLEELIATGKLEYHQQLRAKYPDSLFELFRIPNLGAKRIKTLYEDLGIKSLGELEYACKENRLLELKGFGDKMQTKILDGIAYAQRQSGLHLLNPALDEAARVRDYLAKHKAVQQIEIAGSLRRGKEVIKDIDLLASSKKPHEVMDYFVNAPGVASVTAHGDTKSSVMLDSGIAADLRVVSGDEFPYALQYFTGSKEHNVALRQRCKARNLKLNEYGLFEGGKNLPCQDEADIYRALDLPYIPPELREDMGELELKETPKLVEFGDLRGLVHCHTTYSDGKATLEHMADGAQERGYTYFVVCDHSQSARYAHGLTEDDVVRQHTAIDTLNKKNKSLRIVKGIESDILADGSLDYDKDVLKTFEVVIASVHSKLNMTEKEATTRIIRAVENPRTAILGHPSGRLLLARQGYPLDYDKVFDACKANRVAVEINATPERLDLDWRRIRRAKEKGVKLCIGPDAHSVEGIDKVSNGVMMARKGWLEPTDLLNCLDTKEFLAWCASK